MGRPPKFDDTEVLDRATDLFWRLGSDAVTIRDLEVELELKAPSIYRRFQSKEQLLVRCLDRYVEQQIGRRIEQLLTEAADPLDGIRAFFDSVLVPHRHEQFRRGCFVTNTARSADATDPALRDVIERGLGAIERGFVTQVERAVELGRLDPSTDVTGTAGALAMSFQGLLVLTRGSTEGLEDDIAATLASLLPPRRRAAT